MFFPISKVFAESSFFIVDGMDAIPFKSVSSDGKPEGIFYDIVSSAFNHMKVPLKFEVHPLKRAQNLVQTKRADAFITVPTPERFEYLVPSKEAIFIARDKIFT